MWNNVSKTSAAGVRGRAQYTTTEKRAVPRCLPCLIRLHTHFSICKITCKKRDRQWRTTTFAAPAFCGGPSAFACACIDAKMNAGWKAPLELGGSKLEPYTGPYPCCCVTSNMQKHYFPGVMTLSRVLYESYYWLHLLFSVHCLLCDVRAGRVCKTRRWLMRLRLVRAVAPNPGWLMIRQPISCVQFQK